MVEGHQCHRVAHFHRQRLLGKSFSAVSPNGRFADGAALIDHKTLVRIECHGKNLFYMFDDVAERTRVLRNSGTEESISLVQEPSNGRPELEFSPSMVVMHVHFGMSGRFAVYSLPGPEPKATVRLTLTNEEDGIVAHLSAMTVRHYCDVG